MDLLEDQLANPQSLEQSDRQRTSIPDLELDRITWECRIAWAVSEARMDGRGSHVDADPREAALPFDACGNPGRVRELDLLDRPSQEKHAWHNLEPVRAILRRCVSSRQGRCVKLGVRRIDRGKSPWSSRRLPDSSFASSLKSIVVDNHILKFD